MIKRISITGPESSGKSTLSKDLAIHFDTIFNPEFAREYLSVKKTNYTFEDVEYIAKMQLKSENEAINSANNFLFCDTDLLVVKVWMKIKYNKVPAWIDKEIMKKNYDLYLLCKPDIPWEPDPLRESPLIRDELFTVFNEELTKLNCNFIIINGNFAERFEKARNEVNKIIINSE
ncbi:MAG: ATP-binding protein [Bacteroidota bacterium]